MKMLLLIAARLSFAIIASVTPSALIAEDHVPIKDLKTAELELAAADAAWLGGDVASLRK